jgi:hypothetical protein
LMSLSSFRENYVSYEQLTAQLHAWVEAYPEVVSLLSIGKSAEGRDIWTLVIGRDPKRVRPSAWVDGNMHASELCGSSVSLALAEDLIRLHTKQENLRNLPRTVTKTLDDVLFYITPRLCPDGAEAVLQTGQYVRSNPRDNRVNKSRSYWKCQDVNNDGLALLMRKKDLTGEFVESQEHPNVMLPRQLEDDGPFYKVYPEGVIENFDGTHIPSPYFLSDNDTDLNRNFPWSWMPEPEQVGAGAYPLSEPESRAVADFFGQHPEIFAWLNLHTFGGVYIRPLGHDSDKKMDPFDLAIFHQVEEWCEAFGKYPTVSGFEEFLYEPEKPLHGDMVDFAYHQRGCISYVCELWDLFHQLGFERQRPFVKHYSNLDRKGLLTLARWDEEHNKRRIFGAWRPHHHPQLGEVEVGGIDARVGVSNPPYEKLNEICEQQSAAFLRVAAMAPRLHTRLEVEALQPGLTRLTLHLENHGYLPTYILGSARALPWNEPLTAVAQTVGCALLNVKEHRREIGHLEGWGRGRYGSPSALAFQRSQGNVSSAQLTWLISGEGTVSLRVGACRVGFVQLTAKI